MGPSWLVDAIPRLAAEKWKDASPVSENKPFHTEKRHRRDLGGAYHLRPTDEAVRTLEADHRTALQRLTELEEQLRTKDAELAHVARVSDVGEMATGLVHELSEPLYAISNYVQGGIRRLEKAEYDQEKGKCDLKALMAALEELATEANRASEIITRLRSFVRKREPFRSTANVNDLVQDALELVGKEMRHLGIEVKLDLQDNLPRVFVDTVQIQQCLLNLARNALDAMRQRPSDLHTLTVTTRLSDEETITVAVRDTGEGFSPEKSDRLFESFFTTKSEGLGMGLSLTRSIVRAHGGRIWATSNRERGVTFQFTLPIGSEE